MKALLTLALAALVCGCVSLPAEKPDDAAMKAMFQDALSGQNATASTETPPPTSTVAQTTQTTQAQAQTTTTVKPKTTTTTLAKVPGLECGQVEDPLGPSDCGRASCASNRKCCYLPGSVYKSGSCICASRCPGST
jgi:hypothetical protein